MEHSTQDLKLAQNNDFVVNIFTNYYSKIKRTSDEELRHFEDKINEVDKMVDKFFVDELKRVDESTKQIIGLLNKLNEKIKKLISMYQQKFKEEFITVKEDYDKFRADMKDCKQKKNKNIIKLKNDKFTIFSRNKNKSI